MLPIADLWYSSDPHVWELALECYWQFVQPANLELERSLEHLDLERIRLLDTKGWYNFLRDEYFRWKFTQPNYYAANVGHLQQYERKGDLEELFRIKDELMRFDTSNIRDGLRIATRIRGLGTAGASGLLSLLFPSNFGTVDQFAVSALSQIPNLPESQAVTAMLPKERGKSRSLKIPEGVTLIDIMRRKAADNNRMFETTKWTPRRIDKVLWTYGR